MSIPESRTENDAVVEQARQAAGPALLDTRTGGELAVFHTPEGLRIVDLDDEQYARRADRPRRKQGTTVVRDIASFAQFYAKHSDESSEVYADLDRGAITAVLDAHEPDEPRWAAHRLVLELTPTEAWARWASINRRLIPQVEFAEFLEDNLLDIAPDPVPAAQMLEIAQTFQARTRVAFSSGVVSASGDIRLKYEETTDASGGAKGDMAVPRVFALALAPFDDVDPYRIEARFRHRIEGGKLRLMAILDRPEDVIRDAVKTVVTKVEEATGAAIMRGRPATA
ncbi:DUF2303 family protein [Actinomadura harenae]|uniref:DUF2303 family protein n=1 Tax=Actinomadura harenae TaxID=2483351 RepID=A0A3M2LR22_9ACTN|nr:DUF2303 family protein [Actinomadura harenae]RMI39899.1 DUF2303 family protein [Actinomadura harenae]